ncbi:MAG: hypothetical protein QOE63_1339 [Acidimicrobiaceae bacterium]|jgi:hypothetical protein
MRHEPQEIAVAAVAAAVLSGAPSTVWTLATRGDLLASTRAAGMIVHRPGVIAGAAVHAGMSVGWTIALAAVLPCRGRALGAVLGAAAGAGIAALDLGLVAPRRFPAVAALPLGPQLADHLAFGAIVGWCLGR